jgi:hypothetical protein
MEASKEEVGHRTDFSCELGSFLPLSPARSRFCCALAPLPILLRVVRWYGWSYNFAALTTGGGGEDGFICGEVFH